jgi:hypothetical protein
MATSAASHTVQNPTHRSPWFLAFEPANTWNLGLTTGAAQRPRERRMPRARSRSCLRCCMSVATGGGVGCRAADPRCPRGLPTPSEVMMSRQSSHRKWFHLLSLRREPAEAPTASVDAWCTRVANATACVAGGACAAQPSSLGVSGTSADSGGELQAQHAFRRLHGALCIAIAVPSWGLLPLGVAPAERLGLLLFEGLLDDPFYREAYQRTH